jgi:hypothetical protein
MRLRFKPPFGQTYARYDQLCSGSKHHGVFLGLMDEHFYTLCCREAPEGLALASSLGLHLHQVGRMDLHLQTAEHAEHTTKWPPATTAYPLVECQPIALRNSPRG